MIMLDTLGHLSSTETAQELHDFAGSIGLRRHWYQMPGYGDHHGHYDVMGPNMKHRAISAGAQFVTPEQLLKTSWWYKQPFRALSLKEPWATLVVDGIKPVENRTWRTKYRGGLLIHASQTWDTEGAQWIREHTTVVLKPKDEYIYGAIIGQVELFDCITGYTGYPSAWFAGPYGFVLRRAKRYKRPIIWPGQRKIFSVPYGFNHEGKHKTNQ